VKRALAAALLVSLPLLAEAGARADVTKADCVRANADAQSLRLKGLLGGARDKLTLCADPTCPTMVRDDCTQRLDELERVQPTIVFEAKDASGADVLSVSVTVDGQPLADKLSGTALRVDPGEHAFTFRAEGRPPLARTFVIHEGEKDRRERIEFPRALAATLPTASTGPDHGLGTQRILSLTAGGLGVAGIVVGSVFGVLSTSAASRQDTDCASPTSCLNHMQALSDHSTAATDGAVSTVAFVAAGVLLVAGVTLFFLPAKAPERAAGRFVVTPSVGPGSASLSLRWGS
jgi:hypothetical protein